jgi:CRISPR-associated protein Cas5d
VWTETAGKLCGFLLGGMAMKEGKIHVLKIWGDFGCFSRPELKTERFSYPCPTPSAARGVFDSIYCKAFDRRTKTAQFYWQVEKIELLSYPSYIALRRNEVSHTVAADTTIRQWMRDSEKIKPIVADDKNCRQQRQTMALRNPAFRIHGHIVTRPGFENSINAFDEQFVRRASRGKFFTMPNMGCREFPAFFEYITDIGNEDVPVAFNQDLGFMLYDVFDLRRVNNEFAKPFVSIFKAKINNGILDVPDYFDPKVLKPEVSHAS